MKEFDYSLDYSSLDIRRRPELYRVGRGEQGVLLVEPYKSEILPHWRFRSLPEARTSAAAIYRLYQQYSRSRDFVGMDMARKFLQEKAAVAEVFRRRWERVRTDPSYIAARAEHRKRFEHAE